MNGRNVNTPPVSREDFRIDRTTTRLVSDAIADTAHLSLRLAERLLRNGTVDVSPSGAFAVRLELEEADLPAFQNAIQLRVDLGEAIDSRFRADEPREDDRASDRGLRLSEFVSALRYGSVTRADILAAVRNDVPNAREDEVEDAAWRAIAALERMNVAVEPDAGADQRAPQPPEPFETFTTLGAAASPVLLKATLGRMRTTDFAEAANGRTFQMSRLVVAALTRTAPESFRDISNFVRDQDASATDEEIEDAAMRTMGLGAVR